ncbi:uncharacterized protein LOC117386016 [Periophthalmus magnuspinnatus]|uniref:uncharacterized protein LOC117386016 n=1 Tax=Periophthalmus magnuspinnatus TaxID=409849 RepID=UPI00145BC054|nr:uncharacterized protein LOC117386016 [Periophthalmus magnuspinnatus]
MASLHSLTVQCLLLVSTAQMNGLQEKDIFLPAAFGDNIKLSCISSDNVKIGSRFSWYRQKLGMKPVLISSYFKYDQKDEFYGEFSRDKRFRLDYENDKHDLHINNVSMSDSAVYHCVKCYLHQIDFLESVTVIVKSLEPTIEVRQSAHEEIEPGHTVILNCSVQTESCEGPHRVHWFKQFVESAAGVLYSHGGGNMHDGCKNKGKSPTNFCVYNLPIHNVSSEQTGTYYCAVAACGQVLFGNGTQITIKATPVHVYVLIGALMFTSSLLIGLCIKSSAGSDILYQTQGLKIQVFAFVVAIRKSYCFRNIRHQSEK